MSDHLRRGFLWLGSAAALVRLVDLVGALLFLRYLTQDEVGLAAMAGTVALLFEALQGLGTANAMVQARTITARQLHTLYWFTVVVGVGLWALAAASAPVVAWLYGRPELTALILVAAVKPFFISASVVPMQRLNRALCFRELAAIQALGTTLEATVKVLLAYLGFGAWALVISAACRGVVVWALAMGFANYRPRRVFDYPKIQGMVRFGKRVAGAQLIAYLARNLDYVLVGYFLNMNALGLYRVAFDLTMAPIESIVNFVNRAAFPVFSRLAKTPAAVFRAFASTSRNMLLFNAPVVVLIYFFRDEALLLLEGGGRWVDAGPIVGVLCWAALLRSLVQVFPQLFDALGRPELSLYDAIVGLVLFALTVSVALLVGGHQGPVVVGYAWNLAYFLQMVVLLRLAKALQGFRYRQYLRPVAAASLVVLGLWVLGEGIAALVR